MTKLKSISTILFLPFLLLCSEKKQKKVSLNVTNIREEQPIVDLRVIIDDSTFVNDNFKFSTVTPNYDVFEYSFMQGIHRLDVFRGQVQLFKDTFHLNDDRYIYLSYGADTSGKEKIFIKKTSVNHILQ